MAVSCLAYNKILLQSAYVASRTRVGYLSQRQGYHQYDPSLGITSRPRNPSPGSKYSVVEHLGFGNSNGSTDFG